MFVMTCAAAMVAASPNSADPQMRQGRWETTKGQRNMQTRVGNSSHAGRDRPPVTTTSICSGGPLPGASPPSQNRGCEVKEYQRIGSTVHITTRCRFRDGWKEEATVMNFSPVRYDWKTRVTVSGSGTTSSFEDYGTSRWVGPCKRSS